MPGSTAKVGASGTPLFDSAWYRLQNPDLAPGEASLGHYASFGWRQLRAPHPLFSVRHYFRQRPDVRAAGIEPLAHFLKGGWREGTAPHPLFDLAYYCKQAGDLGGLDPLTHYLTIGWKQGLRANKTFDPVWYLGQYPDTAASGLDPLTHYLAYGWRDRRRPASWLDPDSSLLEGRLPQDQDILTSLAEGAYLSDPRLDLTLSDVSRWRADLDLAPNATPAPARPIGVFAHLFYDGLAEDIADRIARLDLPKRIYVSTDARAKQKAIQRAFAARGLGDVTQVDIYPNTGFDIAPFLAALAKRIDDHDICLKIHGKKSLHNSGEFGESWRGYLFDELMGDPARVRAIVAALAEDATLGVVMPQHWPHLGPWVGIGDNYEPMQRLLSRIDVTLDPLLPIEYPSGSMFWFRAAALKPLVDLRLDWSDFEVSGDRDGSLAHGVERTFLFFAARAGFNWAFLPPTPADFDLTRDESLALIRSSGKFDAQFYLDQNPDLRGTGHDPLEHWFDYGVNEGRTPSATFNVRYYNRLLRRATREKVNPLVHYILRGEAEGWATDRPARMSARIAVDDLYAAYKRAETGPDYVRETEPIIRKTPVKLIAFYFPQFHPFAENDEFWGRGFTEWTNTTKCLPMFPGHYQPRLPGELGFCDTRLKEVLKRQIELAKKYGVHGFCLHHYFFAGKPVMRAPYDLLLANPDLDIPFCLHWANEPWTVRWDGLATKKGMLLDQRHDPDDDIAFFRDIEPAVRDPRYMKIDGRPILVIYRPGLFPDMKATLQRWRKCFAEAGLADPYMMVMQNGFNGAIDPNEFGFDGAIEYPPHNLGKSDVTHRLDLYDPGFEGVAWDYEDTAGSALARKEPDYRLFRGIMPEWDCTPRRANPDLFINCAPHRYQRWLEGLCAKTDDMRASDEKLVFINAWNEWAEGAYLEPDRRYGYAYLQATANALTHYAPAPDDALGQRILVASHIFYVDLLDEFIGYYRNIPGRFDLCVTTPAAHRADVETELTEKLKGKAGKITVIGVDNVGRDFLPFLEHVLPQSMLYDLCCWTHSKKSPYDAAYATWRSYLLDNLMGSRETAYAIVEAFKTDRRLGVVAPAPFRAVADKKQWGSNFDLTQKLLARVGVTISESDKPDFPSAAMFWFRPQALDGLAKLGLTRADFVRWAEGPRDPATGAIVDGTISHALERMIFYIARTADYKVREFQVEPA